MHVLKVGKIQVVFGASWTTLPGVDDQKKEIRDATKKIDANFYCSMDRMGSRPIIGMARNLRGKKYAAAALISQLLPGLKNAVFAMPFDDGSAAAICFVDGLPMVGFDFAGSIEDTCEVIVKFLQTMGKDAGVELYGNFTKFELDFGKVTSFSINQEKLDSEQIARAIFKRSKISAKLIFTLVGLISIAAIAGYLYNNMTEEDLKRRKPIPLDPNVAYQNSVKAALSRIGSPAYKSMPLMMQTISNLPLYLGGWKVSRILCSLESCSTDWVSEALVSSTYEEFRSTLPTGWSAAYKSDFQSVGTVSKTNVAIEPGVNPSDAQSNEEFVIRMGSELQKLKLIGIELKVTPPTLIGLPAPVGGQSPITESQLARPIKEGSWSIAGPWWVTDFIHKLPPNMTMSSVELRNGEAEISLVIEGKYYVTK